MFTTTNVTNRLAARIAETDLDAEDFCRDTPYSIISPQKISHTDWFRPSVERMVTFVVVSILLSARLFCQFLPFHSQVQRQARMRIMSFFHWRILPRQILLCLVWRSFLRLVRTWRIRAEGENVVSSRIVELSLYRYVCTRTTHMCVS